MNCSKFRSQLEDYVDNRLVAGRDACLRHAESCPDCAGLVASERRFREALAQLPVPAPRIDFEGRVLRAAMQAAARPSHPARPRYAAVAAVLVAITAGFFAMQPVPQPAAVIAESSPSPRTVRLVLTAPRALPGAQIRLELPDDSEFAAYKGQRVLEWTADLVQGANLLEVTINGPGKGTAVATVSYRGAQRTLPLPLDSAARTRSQNQLLHAEEYRDA